MANLYAFKVLKYACKHALKKVKMCKKKMQNIQNKISIFIAFYI